MAKMWFLLSAFAAFTSVCALTSAQQCPTTAINAYLDCVNKAHQVEAQSVQADMAQKKQQMEQEKQKMDACFTDNQCQVPQPPKHGGPGNSSESSEEKAENSESEAQRNQTRACFEAVHQQIEQNVASCIQSNTGLVIPVPPAGPHRGPRGPHGSGPKGPPHPGPKGPHGPGGPKGPHGPGEKGGKEDPISKACANSTVQNATQSVLACLNQTHSSFEQGEHQPPAFVQTFCSSKNSCLASLASAGCNASDVKVALRNAAPYRKNCTKAQFENFQQLAAAAPQCQGVNITRAMKGNKGPGKSKEGGPKGPGKSKEGDPKGPGKSKEGDPKGPGGPEHGSEGKKGSEEKDCGEEWTEHDQCEMFEGKEPKCGPPPPHSPPGRR